MKLFKRGDRLQVHVDRLSVGGRGVARHEGLVIFVHDVAPDEDVEVELTLVKRNYADARLLRVTKASPHRVPPPCPVAGVCGGCSWQQVAYPEQLRQKRGLVGESLRKFSGFDIGSLNGSGGSVVVEETVASPGEFHYRNRIQLHHSGPRMGFFKRGSHEIVDIDDCPITEEIIAREIPRLKRELSHTKAGRIELLISSDGRFGTRGLVSGATDADGDDPPRDASEAAGPAFAQVNTAQNQRLVQDVVERIERLLSANSSNGTAGAGIERIFDLYAGSGNFTFPIARVTGADSLLEVIAVEFNQESVARGREIAAQMTAQMKAQSAVQNALALVRFEQGDVGEFLRGQVDSKSLSANSIIVLDPPRTGCGAEVMSAVASARVKHVIYVSCHPVTLARDLRVLKEAGYRLESVRPFDMFPQTDHVETVVQLALS